MPGRTRTVSPRTTWAGQPVPAGLPAGSGLGLAIVAEIAFAHGGTALAAPASPHGLRITLTLPTRSLPRALPAPAVAAHATVLPAPVIVGRYPCQGTGNGPR